MSVRLRQEYNFVYKLCLDNHQNYFVLIIGRQTLSAGTASGEPAYVADILILGLCREMADVFENGDIQTRLCQKNKKKLCPNLLNHFKFLSEKHVG